MTKAARQRPHARHAHARAQPLTHVVGSRQEVHHPGGFAHVGQNRVVQDHQNLLIQVARQLEQRGEAITDAMFGIDH